MDQIVNKFLLLGDKVMPQINLRQPGFTYSACGSFTKINKEYQNLYKQGIQIIFSRMNWIKLVFNMIWLMANTRLRKKNTTR